MTEKFNSYKEVQEFIALYEKENFVQLNHGSSKKLTASSIVKKCPRALSANQELEYYNVTYVCVHGRQYKHSGNHIRQTRSLRTNCPMFIEFKLSLDAKALEITRMIEEHNHKIDVNLYNLFHKNKKLLKSHMKAKFGSIATSRNSTDLQEKNFHCNESMTEDEQNYYSLITPFAFGLTSQQLKLAHKSTHSNEKYTTTAYTCSCDFYKNMKLPCHHIFYVRLKNQEPLCDTDLLDEKYLRKNCNEDYTFDDKQDISEEQSTDLTNNQKYDQTMEICHEIASILSEYEMEEFEKNISTLKIFCHLIKEKKDVHILSSENVNLDVTTSENQLLTGFIKDNDVPIDIKNQNIFQSSQDFYVDNDHSYHKRENFAEAAGINLTNYIS